MLSATLIVAFNFQYVHAVSEFNDEFDASALDSRWTTVDPEGSSSFSLTENPGWLRITTTSPPDRDLYWAKVTAPRIITSGVTGDFTIETKVSASMTHNDEGAGILIWKDSDNFVRLDRMIRFSDDSVTQQIYFSVNGGTEYSETLVLSSNLNATYLRLVRYSDLFMAYYSSDGAAWVPVGNLTCVMSNPVHVGLDVITVYHDGTFYADFDYFRVTANPLGSLTLNVNWSHYTGWSSDVSVYLNSVFVGTAYGTENFNASAVFPAIPDGAYSLRLTRNANKDWVKQVQISAGQTTTVYATLEEGSGVCVTRDETISYDTAFGNLEVFGMERPYTPVSDVAVFVGDEVAGYIVEGKATASGIPAGTYQLKLSKGTNKDWVKQIQITEDQTTTVYATIEVGSGVSVTRNETITCDTSFGNLTVLTKTGASQPASDIEVFVNNELVGYTSEGELAASGIPAGTCQLRLSKDGNKDWIKQIQITGDKTTTVYATIEEGSGTSVTRSETISYDTAFGNLDLFAKERPYQHIQALGVFIDDELIGYTGSDNLDAYEGIPAGTYQLRLSKDGNKDWVKQIQIGDGETTMVYATIEVGSGASVTRNETISYTSAASYGSLGISFNPAIPDVKIYVDREFCGETDSLGNSPTIKGLIEGTYNLTLTKSGYKSWTDELTITADQKTTVSSTLSPTDGSETPSYPAVVLASPTVLGSDKIKFSWSQNDDTDFARYEIFMSTSSDELGNPIYTISERTTTSHTVGGLNASSTYHFTVRSWYTLGQYRDSNQVTATTQAAPEYSVTTVIILVASVSIGGLVLAAIIFVRKRRKKRKSADTIYQASKQKLPPMKHADYIFISHIEEDVDVALEIAKGLDEVGYSTWYYERDSVPGVSYLLTIDHAIQQSKVVIVIVTPASLGSHQVTKEVIRAHEARKEFIPVLRGITHAEFQQRQPEWRAAFGSATSISVPKKGVREIVPRIIRGLEHLGIEKRTEPE